MVTYEPGVRVHLPADACEYHVVGGVMVVDFRNFTGQLVMEPGVCGTVVHAVARPTSATAAPAA